MRGHRSFFLLQCIPTLTPGFIAEPLLLTQHPMQSRGPDQQGLLLCMAVRQSVLRGLELGLGGLRLVGVFEAVGELWRWRWRG